jgi:hypothetical protein
MRNYVTGIQKITSQGASYVVLLQNITGITKSMKVRRVRMQHANNINKTF